MSFDDLFICDPQMIPHRDEVERIWDFCKLEAQATFGERSVDLPSVLRLRDTPSYPETVRKHDVIVVHLTTKRSRTGYLFEAAHEAVHWLDHIRNDDGESYLLEGIAVAFSIRMVARHWGEEARAKQTLLPKYQRAWALAASVDTDAVRLGRRLRLSQDSLVNIKPQAILEHYPEVPAAIVMKALEVFPRS